MDPFWGLCTAEIAPGKRERPAVLVHQASALYTRSRTRKSLLFGLAGRDLDLEALEPLWRQGRLEFPLRVGVGVSLLYQ